jgi:hypothetical protein
MLGNGTHCGHVLPFSLEHIRVVELIHASIIPPPDYGTPIDDAAQGTSVPIFERRNSITLLT